MPSADLDAAAEGVMRSAFSLQNQKCSATSRVYLHRDIAAPFIERLLERIRAMRMGDPSERDVFFGPVINERAVERYERAVAQARTEGRGAPRRRAARRRRLRPRPLRRADRRPAAARAARSSARSCSCRSWRVGEVGSLDEALAETNARGVRPHGGDLLGRRRRSRAVLRRGRGRRVLRQQAHRRHDRRLARRAAVLRLEGLGVDREGRLRAVLRRAVHAGAEPDGDRGRGEGTAS